MACHNDFGQWGEDAAVRWMEQQGFEIAERNFRHGHKEIDIIASKGQCLYFVEVKTRHGEKWKAEEAITFTKRSLIWRAMMAWKTLHPTSMDIRYAVIAVVIQDPEQPAQIRWHDSFWDL